MTARPAPENSGSGRQECQVAQPSAGSHAGTPGLGYLRQLDGLRAVAVLMVLCAHWVPPEVPLLPGAGRLGVDLFFVLSGFLITSILLECRELVRGGRRSLRGALCFYGRRGLRILPLFYATLLAGLVAGVPRVVETWPWHAAYLSNVYLALRGDWAGSVTHFWSLAVEEQFYLVWPWLVFWLPRRWLVPWLLCLAAAAPLFRLTGYLLGWSFVAIRVLTPSCLDTLGTGALLACLARRHGLGALAGDWRVRWMGRLGIPLVIAATLPSAWEPRGFATTVLPGLGAALAFGWLVARAAAGGNGAFGRLLESRALVSLGRISYGVYVIHMFVPGLIARASGLGGGPALPSEGLAALPLLCALTFGAAALSWHCFEKPIQRWKRFLPYEAPPLAPARPAPRAPRPARPPARTPGADQPARRSLRSHSR
jgi:peptidoglycan/LPS O-acetylase OafA/YrhL